MQKSFLVSLVVCGTLAAQNPAASTPATIPAGTMLSVRTVDPIDTRTAELNRRYSGVLTSPLAVNNVQVAPVNSKVQFSAENASSDGSGAAASLVLKVVAIQIGAQMVPIDTGNTAKVKASDSPAQRLQPMKSSVFDAARGGRPAAGVSPVNSTVLTGSQIKVAPGTNLSFSLVLDAAIPTLPLPHSDGGPVVTKMPVADSPVSVSEANQPKAGNPQSSPQVTVAQQGFLAGIVKDPGGNFVVGAVLAFDGLDNKIHALTRTDKKGHYTAGLPPGTYRITVTSNIAIPGSPRTASALVDGFQIGPGSNPPRDFDLSSDVAAAPVIPKPKPASAWTYKTAANFGPEQKPYTEFAARFLRECESGDLPAAEADTLPEQRESVRNAGTIRWIGQSDGIAAVEFAAFRSIPERGGVTVQGYVTFKDGLTWHVIIDEKIIDSQPKLFLFTHFRD